MEKELETLTSLLRRIRQECKALDDNAAASQHGKVSDAYLAGHFSYVENLFDEFKRKLKDSEDVDAEDIKHEAEEVYRHICELRITDNVEEESVGTETTEVRDMDMVCEENQFSDPGDEDSDTDDRPKRSIRKPQILSKTQLEIQQTQWEKAVSLGMDPMPGQVITEKQLQDFQLTQEQLQADAAASAAESMQRNAEHLETYREKQRGFAQHESIGNSHIDMSRDIFDRKDSGEAEPLTSPEDLREQEKTPEESRNQRPQRARSDDPSRQRYEMDRFYQNYENRSNAAFSKREQKAGDKSNHETVPGTASVFGQDHTAGTTPDKNGIPAKDDPPAPDAGSSGCTKAAAAASRVSGESRQRYQLNSISRGYGSLSYVSFSQMAQKAVSKLDNDAIRAGSTGVYYLKTAYGAARIPLSQKPTASLQRSAQRITGKQLTARRQDVIRRNRELRSQISTLEHQLQGISGKKNSVQIRQAEQLKTQITALRSQLPGLQRELKNQDWIRRFQHQRTLDQQLIRELSVKKNHKMPSGSKELQELSRTILKKREAKIHDRYERWCRIPDDQIPRRIQQLTDRGAYLKKQLQLLQRKGALTARERSQLMKLRQQLADTGKQIAELKGLLRAREDLAYVREKLSRVLKNAGKKRQRIIGTAYFARNLALRPVQAGTESNTEWLSKSVSFITDPRTIRYTKKAVSGTTRMAGKAFQKAAPTADNWIRYQVTQKKQAIHKTTKAIRSGVKKAIPTGVRSAAHKAAAPIRGVQKIGTGIHNRLYRMKRWAANTRVGVWVQKQRRILSGIGNALKGVAAAVKGIALKGMLIFAVIFLIMGLIASTAPLIIGAASSTVILAPQSGSTADTVSSGKIDLSPYTRIIRSEISAFNDLIDGLRSEYEGNSDYDNVDVRFSGVSNNLREILSMMAVRMKQDLDTAANPNIDPYLRYLVQLSHTYGISEHRYSCSGCRYRDVTVTKRDPKTGKVIRETIKEPYCPGHIDVSLSINVLSFEQMMAQDSFVIEGEDWEGWNDENTAWCKTIYETDWAELYTGFSISHNAAVGTVISPEDERRIWNEIMAMTNNNPFGTAGLMGNLYAESGLNSINLENSYEELLGYDDASYTQAVDSGSYGGFTDDWAGYGLAQWTDPSRKAGLLAHARSMGTSIGDLGMQLGYLQTELSDSSTLAVLQNALSVREASDEVLVNFERPADQSDSVKLTRASFGEYFYNKYQLGVESEGKLTQKQIDVIKVAANSEAYGIPADKGYCQAWAALVYGAAGLEVDDSASAYQSGIRFGVSDDWSAVPPGAAVYGYAGNQYGHVGIYAGNGLVYHNIGGVAVDTLEDWIRIYDGFCWGWQAGEDLTVP